VLLPLDVSKEENDRTLRALVDGAASATAIDPVVVPTATSNGVKRGARFHYRPGQSVGAGLSDSVFLDLVAPTQSPVVEWSCLAATRDRPAAR